MRLSDLDPELSPPGGEYQQLKFLCPRCKKHKIMIDVWDRPPGDCRVKLNGVANFYAIYRLWRLIRTSNDDWDSFTISPSVNREGLTPSDPCGGWHGVIHGGEVSPS
jgi:hypothetical protein